MSVTLFLNLLLLLFLFLASGFFSGSETALFSLTRIERKRIEEKYPHLSGWLRKLLEKPRRTLITILIGNMFVNTLAAALVTLVAMRYFSAHGGGILMVVFTLALILFAEIIPKVHAVRKNEKIALLTALPLSIIAVLFAPVRIIFKQMTDWILSFVREEKPKAVSDSFSEKELRTLVKVGEEEGILEPQERHMIQKLFELGERPVKSIMVPRIDVIALDIEDPEEKHIDLMKKHHFAHFPVYQETIDHVLGVVSVQEYMLSSRRDLKSIIQQPLYIPETKRIDEVLEAFRSQAVRFAICVDEHGGMDGIVTLEDILEEIFGEYYDEYETAENPVRRYSHDEYLVEAKISLSDFNENFSSHLEAQEASTLGGYILEKLGELPKRGKVLEVPGFEMRIHDVIRHRIRQVLVKPKL